MDDMNSKNKKTKKIEEKRVKKEFNLDENNTPLGLSIDKVKDIAPSLYKEIVNDKSSHELDEIYEGAYSEEPDNLNDDSDNFSDESSTEVDIRDLQKKNMEVIPENYKPRDRPKKDILEGFDPSAVDFIRRAKTKGEALEVINYLEKRKELNEQEAKDLRKKLETEGLEGFGEHKKHGYYFQVAGEHKLKSQMKLTKRKDDLKENNIPKSS
jgi:hypothetical protein